jgi:HK97 family phage prohead protease/HK97 family phage major capsid protein
MPDVSMRRDFMAPIRVAADRGFTAIITTSALDRWGEKIDPAGVRWARSVPVLWAHRVSEPIGRTEQIVRDGDQVMASIRLASEGVSEAADKTYRLIKDGILNSVSVGGIPHRWEGNVVKEFELVEVSVVAVPANAEAEMLSVKGEAAEGLSPGEQRAVERYRAALKGNPQEDLRMDRSGAVTTLRPTALRSSSARPQEPQWNFGKALAFVLEDRSDPSIDWGFERETHEELIHRGVQPRHGGALLPYNGLLQRDIATTPGGAGASLVGIDYRFDLFGLDTTAMRGQLIAGRAGAQVLTSTEPQVVLPRQDRPLPDAQWLARDGAINTQADLNTRSITLTPHTVASRHLLLRSARIYGTPSVYGIYQQQIVQKMNYAVDRAWLYGDAAVDANSPDGLIRQNVQRYFFGTPPTPGPAAPGDATYLGLKDMISLLEILPVDEPRRAWLMSKLLELTLISTYKALDDTSGGGGGPFLTQPIIEYGGGGGGALLARPYLTATQIPVRANASTDIWVGDWPTSGVCYFANGAVEILPNPYSADAYPRGGIELITFQDADAFCLDPSRFVYSNDILLNQAAPPTIPLAGNGGNAKGAKKAA